MSRARELLSQIPPTTLGLMAICGGIQAATYALDIKLTNFSIAALPVVKGLQLYRLVTGSFFHGGLMHLGMNMMSFFYMGCSLERLFGSLPFLLITMVLVFLMNIFYVAVCWIIGAWIVHDVSWLNYHSVGFSGALFAFAVMESFMSPVPTRSVFGFFTVPTRVYPWVLLVVLQVMMPNISFLGHLSGLLCGLCFTRGWLGWAIPKPEYMQRMEGWILLRSMRRLPGYVPAAGDGVQIENAQDSGCGPFLGGACACLTASLAPCLAFGRAVFLQRPPSAVTVPRAAAADAVDLEAGRPSAANGLAGAAAAAVSHGSSASHHSPAAFAGGGNRLSATPSSQLSSSGGGNGGAGGQPATPFSAGAAPVKQHKAVSKQQPPAAAAPSAASPPKTPVRSSYATALTPSPQQQQQQQQSTWQTLGSGRTLGGTAVPSSASQPATAAGGSSRSGKQTRGGRSGAHRSRLLQMAEERAAAAQRRMRGNGGSSGAVAAAAPSPAKPNKARNFGSGRLGDGASANNNSTGGSGGGGMVLTGRGTPVIRPGSAPSAAATTAAVLSGGAELLVPNTNAGSDDAELTDEQLLERALNMSTGTGNL